MWAIESDTEQILKSLLAGAPNVPARITVIGSAKVEWWEGKSGDAVVMASGGSPADRWLGEQIISAQLETIGYKRAQFTFDAEHHTAGWPDIMTKAKRLVQSGNVTLLRNGWNNIVAHVVGDHGEYNSEIGRDDPESRSITTWQCECPWDQYAWQRTRKWKKYEGRPCAHVLATFWKSQATPLDEGPPEGSNLPPGQKAGPPEPAPAPGGGGAPPPGGSPPMPSPIESPPGGQRSFNPEEAMGQSAPMAPPGQGPLPTPPMDQMAEQMPPIPGQTPGGMAANPNIVSVPGAQMPSPFNPIQFPGGTYSGVNPIQIVQTTTPNESLGDAGNFDGSVRQPFIYHQPSRTIYLGNPGMHHDEVAWTKEFAPAKAEYESAFPQSHPDYFQGEINHTPYGKSLGYGGFDKAPEASNVHAALQELYPDLEYKPARLGKIAAEEFVAPEIVRLKKDGYGMAEGKSEAHGAGQYQTIPEGKTGEVLGQDPNTGWVEVIFPLSESSYMEPYHVKMFCEPGELEHTNQAPPGPFIKRR